MVFRVDKMIKGIAIFILIASLTVLLIWGTMVVNSYNEYSIHREAQLNKVAGELIIMAAIFLVTLIVFAALYGLGEHIKLLNEIEKHIHSHNNT